MAIKKSDLYSSIWASCDELRGSMDASQYKDYVLFMLFIKYITDKYGNSTDFAPPVTIPKGASFKDMIALKGKSDIGDKINTQIIQPLIDANARLARSDFPDFNDPNKLGEGQAMVDRLTNLIGIFQKPELDFSQNRADHDDLLGDAYEYLMRHFATESGKSKGQFYTPSEVSRIIAKVIGISAKNTKASTTAYDPTCGSGSLLLKVAAEAGKHITLEGQEKDVTTAGLARMNMILHDFPTANILSGNTLAAPKFKDGEQLRTYDYVVANPPFSDKTWTTGLTPSKDPFQRFSWGEPPAKQGDYAYLLHIVRSMKSTGKAACILPHGVLFRGNAEAVIRQQLVRSGYLKGIIGLPTNLFYGTGIPACILVLDKDNAAGRKGVFMIDASKGFMKDGPKNRLREQDIHRIVDTFTKQADVPRYARMVPFDEITDPKNDFNLNLPRYIDSAEPEDLHDIDGHLRGGIPERDLDALDAYWKVLPTVRGLLFESAGRPGYARLKVPLADVKSSILGHAEFMAFQHRATKTFADWSRTAKSKLVEFDKGGHPKGLIENVAEELLAAFRSVPLLDAYDVYQHLMNYWAETMQDDCYLIAAEGWVAVPARIVETDKKGKKKDKGWSCDLVPKSLVVARYFATELAALDAKQTELEATEAALAALEEEHGGEDGFLGALDKLAKAEVNARLREIRPDKDAKEERAVLEQWLQLNEQAASLKRAVKEQDAALDALALGKYPKLTEADIKALVIDDKWLARLSTAVQGELERVSRSLTSRVRELAERYAHPLTQMTEMLTAASVSVDGHLTHMQALLTGATRVPGFSGAWETRTIEQLADCLDGVRVPLNEAQRAAMKGDYPYCGANGVLDYVNDYVLDDDVILMAEDGGYFDEYETRPIAYRMKGRCWVNNHAHILRAKPGVDQGFLFYSLVHKNILPFLASGTRAKLNKSEMNKIEVKLPIEEAEQAAVAAVLSDIDAKLAALDGVRDKTRDLRRAAMQTLLSGNMRLRRRFGGARV